MTFRVTTAASGKRWATIDVAVSAERNKNAKIFLKTGTTC